MNERNLIMEKAAGAVAMANSQYWNSKAGRMFAFLSVIHPEIPLEKRLKMARETETD